MSTTSSDVSHQKNPPGLNSSVDNVIPLLSRAPHPAMTNSSDRITVCRGKNIDSGSCHNYLLSALKDYWVWDVEKERRERPGLESEEV